MRPNILLFSLPGALLAARPAAAQHFSLEAGSGPCLGFTTLVAPRGLPPKTQILHRVSPAFSLGLRYQAGHSLTVLAVNSAGLAQGIRTDGLVTQRDANGAITGTSSGSSAGRSAPAHFTLGSGYTTTLHQKITLSTLAGLGYMLVRPGYGSVGAFGTGTPPPEESVSYVLNETTVRRGSLGLFTETRAEIRLGGHSSLGVAGRYYHGLRTVRRIDSSLFQYSNARTNTVENYDVALLNKGRYVALRVFYGYTL